MSSDILRRISNEPTLKQAVGTCCVSAIALSALACLSANAAQVYNSNGVSLDIFGSVQAVYADRDMYQDLAEEGLQPVLNDYLYV